MPTPKPGKPWTREQKQAAEDKEWAKGNSPIETVIKGVRYKVTPGGLVKVKKSTAQPLAPELQERLNSLTGAQAQAIIKSKRKKPAKGNG